MKANEENLQECLEKIGWSIKGVSPNRWIVNHKGERTQFRVRKDSIEIRNKDIFGAKASNHGMTGSVDFYFSGCSVSVHKESDSVTLAPNNNGSAFISFYNFDIIKNKKK